MDLTNINNMVGKTQGNHTVSRPIGTKAKEPSKSDVQATPKDSAPVSEGTIAEAPKESSINKLDFPNGVKVQEDQEKGQLSVQLPGGYSFEATENSLAGVDGKGQKLEVGASSDAEGNLLLQATDSTGRLIEAVPATGVMAVTNKLRNTSQVLFPDNSQQITVISRHRDPGTGETTETPATLGFSADGSDFKASEGFVGEVKGNTLTWTVNGQTKTSELLFPAPEGRYGSEPASQPPAQKPEAPAVVPNPEPVAQKEKPGVQPEPQVKAEEPAKSSSAPQLLFGDVMDMFGGQGPEPALSSALPGETPANGLQRISKPSGGSMTILPNGITLDVNGAGEATAFTADGTSFGVTKSEVPSGDTRYSFTDNKAQTFDLFAESNAFAVSSKDFVQTVHEDGQVETLMKNADGAAVRHLQMPSGQQFGPDPKVVLGDKAPNFPWNQTGAGSSEQLPIQKPTKPGVWQRVKNFFTGKSSASNPPHQMPPFAGQPMPGMGGFPGQNYDCGPGQPPAQPPVGGMPPGYGYEDPMQKEMMRQMKMMNTVNMLQMGAMTLSTIFSPFSMGCFMSPCGFF